MPYLSDIPYVSVNHLTNNIYITLLLFGLGDFLFGVSGLLVDLHVCLSRLLVYRLDLLVYLSKLLVCWFAI